MRSPHGFLIVFVLLVRVLVARADDWPQWRGPNRDGHSKETGLLEVWPKDGPRLIWQVKDLGSGYSTPSVADGRLYVMTNRGLEDEFVTERRRQLYTILLNRTETRRSGFDGSHDPPETAAATDEPQ